MLLDAGERLLTSTPKAVMSRYQRLLYSPSERRNAVRDEIRAFERSGPTPEEEQSFASPLRVDGTAAEVRAIEMVEEGAAKTPFLRFGDRVRIEMFDAHGRSIFGAIDQTVVQARPAEIAASGAAS